VSRRDCRQQSAEPKSKQADTLNTGLTTQLRDRNSHVFGPDLDLITVGIDVGGIARTSVIKPQGGDAAGGSRFGERPHASMGTNGLIAKGIADNDPKVGRAPRRRLMKPTEELPITRPEVNREGKIPEGFGVTLDLGIGAQGYLLSRCPILIHRLSFLHTQRARKSTWFACVCVPKNVV